MTRRQSLSVALAILGYATVISVVSTSMMMARNWALETLDSTAARRQWDQWREDVREQRDSQAGSVTRRVPQATEPPALVLMRDYFGVCLFGAVLFSVLVFSALLFFATGAFSGRASGMFASTYTRHAKQVR